MANILQYQPSVLLQILFMKSQTCTTAMLNLADSTAARKNEVEVQLRSKVMYLSDLPSSKTCISSWRHQSQALYGTPCLNKEQQFHWIGALFLWLGIPHRLTDFLPSFLDGARGQLFLHVI